MNMMTTIEAREGGAAMRTDTPMAGSGRKWYFDENGEPSERSGPDLAKAEPIEETMKRLAYRRTGDSGSYSTVFYQAAKDSGIHLYATREDDGEHLIMMLPCDGQEELRLARYEPLAAHVRAKPARRQTVIDLMKLIGRYHDNRRFATIEEAAREFVGAGGRIYVLPDGTCEEALPTQIAVADDWKLGYPVRQMVSRYDATLRRKGARQEMAAYVLAHGKLYEGSGAYVIMGDGK